MTPARPPRLSLTALCLGLGLALAPGCAQDEMAMDGPDTPDGGQVGPTPTCTDRAPLGAFDVDVATVTLSGKITVNGKQPTSQTGTVTLVNRETGDSIYLGRTGDPNYAQKRVIAGTYDLVYAWSGQSDMGDVPRNLRARLRTGVEIKASGALDVDLQAVTLSGKITVSGQVPMANTGSVTLRDPKTGDSFYLGRTSDPNYAPKLVLPGTYDVHYAWSGQSTNPIDVPRNSNARVRAGVTVSQTGTLDVEIPVITLNGKVTVNGQTPMANTGSVNLVSRETGDSLYLGRTSDATYSAKLIVPGTYDVVYSWSGQSSNPIDVPRNDGARLRSGVSLLQSGMLNVDIPAVTVNGKITVNGQIPMANTGTVTLRGTEVGTLSLGATAAMSYQAKLVVPGSYDLYYSWSGQGTGTIDVPRNSSARLRSGVAVKEGGALDVDIPAVTLMGKITMDGKTPMARTGQVLLRNPAQGDSVSLGRTGDPAYAAKMIVPAPYNIVYSWSGMSDPADDVPRNTAALLGCKLLSDK